eukprot:2676989-Pyramimonas_sp.AAC.1
MVHARSLLLSVSDGKRAACHKARNRVPCEAAEAMTESSNGASVAVHVSEFGENVPGKRPWLPCDWSPH